VPDEQTHQRIRLIRDLVTHAPQQRDRRLRVIAPDDQAVAAVLRDDLGTP